MQQQCCTHDMCHIYSTDQAQPSLQGALIHFDTWAGTQVHVFCNLGYDAPSMFQTYKLPLHL